MFAASTDRRLMCMTTTFILIPGAWHTASSWLPVARRLRGAGARADIVELPGQRSVDSEAPASVRMADAPAALIDHLRAHDLRDVVLVGHSLGGYVIGGALGSLTDRVQRVLYYNAHIPVPELSMSEAFPDRMEQLRAAAEASSDGSVPVPGLGLIREAFVPGTSPDFQQLLRELLVPAPRAYFLEAVDRPTRPSDHGIDFSYILGESDLILPPPASQFAAMLRTAPVIMSGGHESLLTNPTELAGTLLELA
jgi:pimeloyl-ACP methyl ester carboxylesterase